MAAAEGPVSTCRDLPSQRTSDARHGAAIEEHRGPSRSESSPGGPERRPRACYTPPVPDILLTPRQRENLLLEEGPALAQ